MKWCEACGAFLQRLRSEIETPKTGPLGRQAFAGCKSFDCPDRRNPASGTGYCVSHERELGLR